MKRILKSLVFGASGLLLVSALSAKANSVTVAEVGIGANEVVNITSSMLGTANVYAGVVNLTVNGIATPGFCIDPFHWSVSGPKLYDSEPLAEGPKSPGGAMGTDEATWIEKLWTKYYVPFGPTIGNDQAAALQIAIWEIIGAGATGGNSFTLNGYDYGAAAMVTDIKTDSTTTPANLMAVTGPGQDYVVPNSGGGGSVPDGGTTILLLGGALCGLALIRRKVCAC